jgi:hypothetical protein
MNTPKVNFALPRQSNHDVARLLVALGKVLLKNQPCSDWYGMQELSDLCQDHDLELNDSTPNSKQLEALLRALFEQADELYQDGINVIWNDNQIEWDSVFQIKFYKYDPNTTSHD